MLLRDYLSGIYFYCRMWPPAWAGVASSVQTPRGEVGCLVEVRNSSVNSRRIFLVIEHEGKRFTGYLMFKDDASCERISNLLQVCRGMRIEDIGNLEITFSVFPPLPGQGAFKRRAFWVIPRLMQR
jgi:hypothetical protein